MLKRVIIIGGGPAGMMAALEASKAGSDLEVFLLEKNDVLGKKLKITGKGRCNITNTAPLTEFIENIPGNGAFLFSAFNKFNNDDLVSFFNDRGVKTKVERGGRVFPISDSSENVINALTRELKQSKVKILYQKKVIDLIVENNKVKGIKLKDDGDMLCDYVILATGGASYPGTGSTGDGYKIAAKVGHSLSKLMPGLVPLEAAEDWVPQAQGLALKNASVKALINDRVLDEQFGELLFTHFGVSGPVILTISRNILPTLAENNNVKLVINLKPALSSEELEKRIQKDLDIRNNKMFKNCLDDLLPQKIIPVIIELSGINPDKKANQVNKKERQNLTELLQNLTLTVDKYRPIKEAIVTVGGIKIKEISPRTIESKIIENLYFAGEIIDVDGYTGGFNLQIAFTTGYIAGNSIAEKNKK